MKLKRIILCMLLASIFTFLSLAPAFIYADDKEIVEETPVVTEKVVNDEVKDTTEKKLQEELTVKDVNVPDSKEAGQYSDINLSGTITAIKTVSKVQVVISKTEEISDEAKECTVEKNDVNSSVVDLSCMVIKGEDLNSLNPGTHFFAVMLYYQDGTNEKMYLGEFEVQGFSFELSGVNHPDSLSFGSSYSIGGTIISNNVLEKVELGIKKNGEYVKDHKLQKTFSTNSVSIGKIFDAGLKFGDLGTGNYEYVGYAYSEGKWYTLFEYTFTVKGNFKKVKISKRTNTKQRATLLTNMNKVEGKQYYQLWKSRRVAWCAKIVNHFAYKKNIKDLKKVTGTTWVPAIIVKAASKKTAAKYYRNTKTKRYVPQPGDLVIEHGIGHVAVVEKVEGDRVYTIAGNEGHDKCGLKSACCVGKNKKTKSRKCYSRVRKASYPINSSYITGYVHW